MRGFRAALNWHFHVQCVLPNRRTETANPIIPLGRSHERHRLHLRTSCNARRLRVSDTRQGSQPTPARIWL